MIFMSNPKGKAKANFNFHSNIQFESSILRFMLKF